MSVCQNPELKKSEDKEDEIHITLPPRPHHESYEITCKKNQRIIIHEAQSDEYIRIKKTLWDEMVEYKKKVDDLNRGHSALHFEISGSNETIRILGKRISELEDWNSCSVKDQEMHYKEFRERIEKLEYKQNDFNKNVLPGIGFQLQYINKAYANNLIERIEKLESKMNDIYPELN